MSDDDIYAWGQRHGSLGRIREKFEAMEAAMRRAVELCQVNGQRGSWIDHMERDLRLALSGATKEQNR